MPRKTMKKRGRKRGGAQTVSPTSEFAKNRRDDDESVSANTKSKTAIQEFFVRPPLPRKKKSWTVAVKSSRSRSSKNKSSSAESKAV